MFSLFMAEWKTDIYGAFQNFQKDLKGDLKNGEFCNSLWMIKW